MSAVLADEKSPELPGALGGVSKETPASPTSPASPAVGSFVPQQRSGGASQVKESPGSPPGAQGGGSSSDGSTSAGSGTEGSLEETINSTASKEFSFGTSQNQTLVSSATALANGAPAPDSPQGAAASKLLAAKEPALASPAPALGERQATPCSGSSPGSPPAPAATPRSPGKRAKAVAEEEEEDSGNEFTFGTSQPIQLPDFSQVPKPGLHPAEAQTRSPRQTRNSSPRFQAGTLRQTGNSPGEDCRELAVLAPVQEGNEKPLPPPSPPPSAHVQPPPPVGAHPHPYVSPRLPHPSAWHPHMSPPPQSFYGQAGPMPPQMYAASPGAMAVYNPAAAAAACAAYDPTAAHNAALAQVQAQQAQLAFAEQQACAGYEHAQEPGEEAGMEEGAYGPYFGGEESSHQPSRKMPLAYKIAFLLEATCSEVCNCKGLQVKKMVACSCMLLIVAGAAAIVTFLLNSRDSA
eukprot:TRINITY_DN6435_c0_g1_i1.p1 TRINITY_DN6435_c0_g1~~TRINITY_DN6435_c0_g1_i1.p1  ORF type:complete len:464 (+),score=113.07 TRINITY_DN6435_c0_g1_i1:94-1485(+)